MKLMCYEMRFDKKPKIVRKLTDGEDIPIVSKTSKANNGTKKSVPSSGNGNGTKKIEESANKDKLPTIVTPESQMNDLSLGVSGVGINSTTVAEKKKASDDTTVKFEERLLKPPPQFGGDMEMKQLASVISREIYQESPNVRFSDIIRLEEAKRLLIEAVQLPLRFPYLFTGILRPWRGILLHGPPGTGKTLLAKAVATECNTTFFNISASTLVSKWRGDSEKLVRVLFEVARYHSPSTIFLDEIDSILTSRDGEGGEHEASRRMKTELLIQMDGVKGRSTVEQQVFVMAASNLPWDLDVAVLRRLEKRVLVPLPEKEARELMLKKHISDRVDSTVDFTQVAEQTVGYSGADIELVCRESAMMPVRRLMQRIDELDNNSNPLSSTAEPSLPPASSASIRNTNSALQHQQSSKGIIPPKILSPPPRSADIESLLRADPVTQNDILAALRTTKPSSDGNFIRYESWQKDFGSV